MCWLGSLQEQIGPDSSVEWVLIYMCACCGCSTCAHGPVTGFNPIRRLNDGKCSALELIQIKSKWLWFVSLKNPWQQSQWADSRVSKDSISLTGEAIKLWTGMSFEAKCCVTWASHVLMSVSCGQLLTLVPLPARHRDKPPEWRQSNRWLSAL